MKLSKLLNIIRAEPRHYFIGGFLVFVFLLTRILFINQIPPSVYWDEASIGYNAYSISQNLRDEWGEFLPLHFRAFGEFKLPAYIYTTAAAVKIFGLNALSVRLPAVLYSLVSIIFLYKITLKLTADKTSAMLSAFVLGISPWFFIFSRTGYEMTAGVAFFLGGIYLLIDKASRFRFLGGVACLVASMYSYNSFRIIAPIVFVLFSFLRVRKGLKENIPLVILCGIFFVLAMVPIVRLFIYDAGFGRAQSFALIPGIQQVYDLEGKPHLQIIFDRNANINWATNVKKIFSNYLSHASWPFLFGGDKNPRSQQPGFGQVNLADVILLLIGVFYVLKKRKTKYFVVLLLFLMGFLPVAFFKESPHALRSLSAVPFISLLIALGIGYLRRQFKKYSVLVLAGVLLYYFFSFENYYLNFLNDYSQRTSSDWQYGYRQIYDKYKGEFQNYDRVIITDEYAQPYIFALYYLKYSPSDFLATRKLSPVNNWGFSTVAAFGNFEFRKATPQDLVPGSLVFATPKEISATPSFEIKNLDGSVSLLVYEKK